MVYKLTIQCIKNDYKWLFLRTILVRSSAKKAISFFYTTSYRNYSEVRAFKLNHDEYDGFDKEPYDDDNNNDSKIVMTPSEEMNPNKTEKPLLPLNSSVKYIIEEKARHKIEGAKYLLCNEDNLQIKDYKSITKSFSNVLKSGEVVKLTLSIYSLFKTTKRTIDEELYNDILINLVNNYAVSECYKFYLILLRKLPVEEYKCLKTRMNEIWEEMISNSYSLNAEVIRTLFLRLSFYTHTKRLLCDDIEEFKSLGFPIPNNCYTSALFQLYRCVNPKIISFFKVVKELNIVSSRDYVIYIRYCIENREIAIALNVFQEAIRKYDDEPSLHIEIFKSLLFNNYCAESLNIYDRFVEKLSKEGAVDGDFYTREINNTALFFLTRNSLIPIAHHFIERMLDPITRLPKEITHVSLIAFIYLRNMEKFKDLLERMPDNAFIIDRKLLSTFILAYLCSDFPFRFKMDILDFAITRYRMRDGIKNSPWCPLAKVGSELEEKLGVIIQFAHVHQNEFNFAVLYRLMRLAFHRSKDHLIIQIYKLFRSKPHLIIQAESFQYLISAFIKYNEWRLVFDVVTHAKKEKLQFSTHKFPFVERVFFSVGVIYDALNDTRPCYSDSDSVQDLLHYLILKIQPTQVPIEEIRKFEALLQSLNLQTIGDLRKYKLNYLSIISSNLLKAVIDALSLPKSLTELYTKPDFKNVSNRKNDY